MNGILGIDVSQWQSLIHWQQVKLSAIDFVMVRASYGKNGRDHDFVSNIKGAQKAGIETGAYHYCYAKTAAEAVKEAEFFLSVIKTEKITYPVALDLEDGSIGALSKEQITEIALAFLNTVKKNGYYTMLYSNLNWIRNKIDIKKLQEFDLWIADWSEPFEDIEHKVGIWQYSDKGTLLGITGVVDYDKSFYDYKKIIKEMGLNHLEKEISIEEAIDIVRTKANLEERTMNFLMNYKFGDVLIKKLAKAMNEN